MGELVGLLIIVLMMLAFLFVVLALLGFAVYVLARHMTKQREAAWSALAKKLGLTFTFARGQMTITGQLDGVEVKVDTSNQRQFVARVEGGYHRSVPWTYVEARPATASVEMRPHGSGDSPIADMRQQATGDPALDERYDFFVAEGASLDEALPPEVRAALKGTEENVFITGGTVRWLRSGIVLDPERLTNALRLCARIAGVCR